MLSRVSLFAASFAAVAAKNATAAVNTTAVGLSKMMNYTLDASTGQDLTADTDGSWNGYIIGSIFCATFAVAGICHFFCNDLRNVPAEEPAEQNLNRIGYGVL